jgi:hypothetical protein
MRKLTFSTLVLFLISLGVTVVIIFNTNPQSGGIFTFFAFFFSLWISIWSFILILFSVLLFRIRRERDKMLSLLRRSMLVATLIVSLLVLSSLGVLSLLSGLALILVGGLSELFFINRKLEKSS